MNCGSKDCPYCYSYYQRLDIFFRIRMPERVHQELRARHKNVSAYIRNLILEDLHKDPETVIKPGMKREPVNPYKKGVKEEYIPYQPKGLYDPNVAHLEM